MGASVGSDVVISFSAECVWAPIGGGKWSCLVPRVRGPVVVGGGSETLDVAAWVVVLSDASYALVSAYDDATDVLVVWCGALVVYA